MSVCVCVCVCVKIRNFRLSLTKNYPEDLFGGSRVGNFSLFGNSLSLSLTLSLSLYIYI